MKKIVIIFLALCSPMCVIMAERKQFHDHKGAVTAITFDKKGKTIISGSEDGTLHKRDIDNGQTRVIGDLGKVNQVKRIGKFLAVVQDKPMDDDAIKHPRPEFYYLKDLSYNSSGAVKDGAGHAHAISDMQIINSKSMVSGDKEGKLVFLYNCMRSVVMNAGSSIDRLSVVSPSRIIGISCNQDRLYKFDPELNQVWHRTFFNASGQMAGIAALKEYLLAIAFKDGKVALLNDKTGKTQIKLFQACNSEVVDIQKINKRFFATVRKDGTTNIWDSKTPGCKKVFMGAGGAAAVTAVGIQWDKKKKEAIIATGYSDGRMLINRTQLN